MTDDHVMHTFTLDLEHVGAVLYHAMRERRGEASALAASTVRPWEALGERERETARLLAADVARVTVDALVREGARHTPDGWAARYLTLAEVVSNPRLVTNIEMVVATAEAGQRVTGRPMALLLARILFYFTLIRFETFDHDGRLYENHAPTCGFNDLTAFRPCSCGEAERIEASARARFSAPRHTDEQLRDIYAAVAAGAGDHGSFLRGFAEAFMAADRDNMVLLRPSALALAEKYDLGRHLGREEGAS